MTESGAVTGGPSSRERRVHPVLAAVVIVVYFALTTAWLPSAVLRTSTLSSADRWVTDLVGTSVWGVFLVVGLVALRRAQRRGLI